MRYTLAIFLSLETVFHMIYLLYYTDSSSRHLLCILKLEQNQNLRHYLPLISLSPWKLDASITMGTIDMLEILHFKSYVLIFRLLQCPQFML